jgi:hypothetical protein
MRTIALALGGLWLARTACAQAPPAADEPAPDLDFLEYLGSWQDDDDAWVAIEEWNKDNGPRAGNRGRAGQGPAPRVDGDASPRAAERPPTEPEDER